LFTYPKSKLAFATGLRHLTIFTTPESPVIYSLFDNGLKHFKKLQYCYITITHWGKDQTVKSRALVAQIKEYFFESVAKEEHMKAVSKVFL
jgi:hypothetical protein